MNFKRMSIRRVMLLLCVMIVTSVIAMAPVSATEEPCDFGLKYCVVTSETLNVRASASEEAEIVDVLTVGTYVKVNWEERCVQWRRTYGIRFRRVCCCL